MAVAWFCVAVSCIVVETVCAGVAYFTGRFVVCAACGVRGLWLCVVVDCVWFGDELTAAGCMFCDVGWLWGRGLVVFGLFCGACSLTVACRGGFPHLVVLG